MGELGAFEEPEWSIPYCEFKPTAEGFKVEFICPPDHAEAIRFAVVIFVPALLIGAIVLGIFISNLTDHAGSGVLFFLFAACYIFASLHAADRAIPSVIEVTGDSVIVDGKRLRRAAFSHFLIDHRLGPSNSMGVLGYQYGSKTFAFGGIWKDLGQANEFLNNLNHAVRHVPMTNSENAATPQMLRSVRPTDF